MSREVIRIEDEAFNEKLLRTTTVDEYVKCHEEYLGEPIGERNIGFANNEVVKHLARLLMEENRKKGLTEPDGVLPDGTNVYISPGIGGVDPRLLKP